MGCAFELHRSSRRVAESCWDILAELGSQRAALPRWRVLRWLWLTAKLAVWSRQAATWEAEAHQWLELAIARGEMTEVES